jgi:ABC-type uncharacterized transport system permease subunit
MKEFLTELRNGSAFLVGYCAVSFVIGNTELTWSTVTSSGLVIIITSLWLRRYA